MADFLDRVLAVQPDGDEVEVWVEPFAGGGGAGLSLLSRGSIEELWLVEKNPAIAAFWRVALREPADLIHRVRSTRISMDTWGDSVGLIAEVEAGGRAHDADLAFAALVVNRCSRSGMVGPKVGPIGGKGQEGKWTIMSRWYPETIERRIQSISALGSRIRVFEGCAMDHIEEISKSGFEDEVFLFVDPPYLREGNRLYAHGMTFDEHRRLAEALNGSPSRWLLTYDNERAVRDDLYPEQVIIEFEIANTANKTRTALEYAVVSDNVLIPRDVDVIRGKGSRLLSGRAIAC